MKIKFYKWLLPKWNKFFSRLDNWQVHVWLRMGMLIGDDTVENNVTQEHTPEKTKEIWEDTYQRSSFERWEKRQRYSKYREIAEHKSNSFRGR